MQKSLEEIFLKATRLPTLTKNLIYFITALGSSNGSDDEVVSETLIWARSVARDTLRAGLDVVASLT